MIELQEKFITAEERQDEIEKKQEKIEIELDKLKAELSLQKKKKNEAQNYLYKEVSIVSQIKENFEEMKAILDKTEEKLDQIEMKKFHQIEGMLDQIKEKLDQAEEKKLNRIVRRIGRMEKELNQVEKELAKANAMQELIKRDCKEFDDYKKIR